MTSALWAVLAASLLTPGSDGQGKRQVQGPADLMRLHTQTPTCPAGEETRFCVGLALHVVRGEDGELVQDEAWLRKQLAEAKRHFGAIDLAFEVVSVDELPASDWEIDTREHRDALGRERFSRGVVHVFMVGQLDDVDVAGEVIRGVHWRQRSNTDKRWIIISRIAMPMVLAHELGHFFGLPHSRYPISIMNKRDRAKPPRAERTFHPEEVTIIRQRRDAMRRDGSLRMGARR